MSGLRATWDETWMATALAVAKRSACERAQAGVVIVDETQRIVATGYNGPPAGIWVGHERGCAAWCPRGAGGPQGDPTSYDDCVAVHAEQNALMFCDRRDRLGGTLYVTTSVCVTCAKLVANSGLTRVVVAVDEDRDYRDPGRGIGLLVKTSLVVDTIEVER